MEPIRSPLATPDRQGICPPTAVLGRAADLGTSPLTTPDQQETHAPSDSLRALVSRQTDELVEAMATTLPPPSSFAETARARNVAVARQAGSAADFEGDHSWVNDPEASARERDPTNSAGSTPQGRKRTEHRGQDDGASPASGGASSRELAPLATPGTSKAAALQMGLEGPGDHSSSDDMVASALALAREWAADLAAANVAKVAAAPAGFELDVVRARVAAAPSPGLRADMVDPETAAPYEIRRQEKPAIAASTAGVSHNGVAKSAGASTLVATSDLASAGQSARGPARSVAQEKAAIMCASPPAPIASCPPSWQHLEARCGEPLGRAQQPGRQDQRAKPPMAPRGERPCVATAAALLAAPSLEIRHFDELFNM